LRRLIQDTLEANISKMILKDELKKGEAITLSQAILNS
jgi:ATP-dependent Clp protease ATP-binding subunit ClpA